MFICRLILVHMDVELMPQVLMQRLKWPIVLL